MQQHTIRYISKSREEYEEGNGYACARCGRQHRHATEIDGKVYGKVCAVKVMSELEIINTAPAPSKKLASLTVAEIKNIVHPFHRRTVSTEFVLYHLDKLTHFTKQHAMSILSHWTIERVNEVATRQQTDAPVYQDWQTINMLKPLFN